MVEEGDKAPGIEIPDSSEGQSDFEQFSLMETVETRSAVLTCFYPGDFEPVENAVHALAEKRDEVAPAKIAIDHGGL